jgi:putative spermidine/putrescine transport system permease protein
MFRRASLLVYLLLCIVPLLLGLGYVLAYSFGLIGLLNHGFTTAHWRAVLLDKTFWQSLGYSLYIALACMSIVVVVSAALLAGFRKNLTQGFLSAFIYLPLTLPAIVAAFVCFQLWSKSGLISRMVYQVGWIANLDQFPEWINDAWGLGIIFTHTFMATPFFTLLFLQVYEREKIQRLEQLAFTLGATPRQAWLKVTAPILWRKSFFSILLYLVFVMGAYETPLLLGRQSPEMIAPLIIRKLQKFNLLDMPQAYVISAAYLLLLMGFGGLVFSKIKTRMA